MRITCLLAIGVTIVGLATPAAPHAGDAPRGAPAVVPLAAIDLGGLFGNENEADENEADENEGGQSAGQTDQGPSVSIPVVLLLVVLAAIAGAWTAIRVRRMWLRLQGWGRGLRSRARL